MRIDERWLRIEIKKLSQPSEKRHQHRHQGLGDRDADVIHAASLDGVSSSAAPDCCCLDCAGPAPRRRGCAFHQHETSLAAELHGSAVTCAIDEIDSGDSVATQERE